MLSPFLLHALSPLHAGTGHSTDVIDLPIARMTGTNIPIAPGSGIKGVLRDARREQPRGDNSPDWTYRHFATFGPDTANAAEHAGALVVGDARLLALPVRSFKGVFAWVTSPLLLTLAKRDLCGAWGDLAVPLFQTSSRSARVKNGANGAMDSLCVHAGKVYLQDLDLAAAPDADVGAWGAKIAPAVFTGGDIFTQRFVVADDDTMAFLWETATQVDQRIRIKNDTRTVADGALWREESLPPETLMIGLLEAGPSRRKRKDDEPGKKLENEDVMNFALGADATLQFGGKATIGRGRCRMIPVT